MHEEEHDEDHLGGSDRQGDDRIPEERKPLGDVPLAQVDVGGPYGDSSANEECQHDGKVHARGDNVVVTFVGFDGFFVVLHHAIPSGAKAPIFSCDLSARLKPYPFKTLPNAG
jgi:hypothetical protein